MELKEAKHILEERKYLLINSSMPDTSLITAIDIVLKELDELQKTLKCTQDSWYEDTQKIQAIKQILNKEKIIWN